MSLATQIGECSTTAAIKEDSLVTTNGGLINVSPYVPTQNNHLAPSQTAAAAALTFTVTYSGQQTRTWNWSDGTRDRITLNAAGTVQIKPYRAITTDAQSFVSSVADLDSANHVSGSAIEDGSVPTHTFNFDVGRPVSRTPSSTDSRFTSDGYLYFETKDVVPAPANDITVYAWEYVSSLHVLRMWVALPDPFYYPDASYEHYDFPATHVVANQSAAHSSLLGTVLDSQNAAIGGAQVVFGGVSRTTDAQGKFQYDDIPPGSYVLRIAKQGFNGLTNAYTVPAFSIIQNSYTIVEKRPPVASFVFTPATPVAGEVVEFDARASSESDGLIVSYEWDFESDGMVDVQGASAIRSTHVFRSRAGLFKVKLTVIDNDGFSSSITRDVSVQVCDDRKDKPSAWQIQFGNVHWFTPDGPVGEPVIADSGQKLEVFWHPSFSGGLYELVFTGVGGTPAGRVGQCHFADGANTAFFWAPDRDGNGHPDFFRRVRWISIDGGADDNHDGRLDVIVHNYDVCMDKYARQKFVLTYRCGPALPAVSGDSDYEFPAECRPPWLESGFEPLSASMTFIDPPLGPQSEALFDALLAEQAANPVTNIAMGRFVIEPRDLNWDGSYDVTDFQIIAAAIGTCTNSASFNPFADIDLDGCVTVNDLKLVAMSDSDADGMADWEEYVAGTDPFDPASVFRILDVRPAVEGGVTVRWSSVRNRTYTIERSAEPSGSYVAVTNNIAATPPVNTISIATPVTGNSSFYRISVK